MKNLEKELTNYVNQIANEIKKKSDQSINWKKNIYSIITELIEDIVAEYNISNEQKEKIINSLFNKGIERISNSKSNKYLTVNLDNLNSTEDKISVLLGDNSFYELNEKEIKQLLSKDFVYPLKVKLELEKKLGMEINKRRTYRLEFLKKVKEIEINTKNTIPKPKQTECVIMANRETNDFNESDLIDKSGNPTNLLISIRNAYKSQKRNL